MSFGKKKDKTKQQQTSTQALDPQVKSTLLGNVASAQSIANTPFQAFTGQRVADFTPTQVAGQQKRLDIADAHIGSDLFEGAANMAKAITTAAPKMVTASTYKPTSATAASVNRGDIRDVTSGPVSAEAIRGYFDPYENDVVNTALSDVERQRQIRQAYVKAQATKNSAFGGTGGDVAAALADEDFTRQAAQTAAGLRSQGFSQALAAAQADAGRGLQAGIANQGVDLSVAGHNADLLNGANLFNAGATNDAGRFNAGQAQAADIANQGASAQGNLANLQAANLLASIGGQQHDAAVADAGLYGQVGKEQQALVQAQLDAIYEEYLRAQDDPIKKQQLLNQAVGLMGNPTLTQSQGTSKTTGSSFQIGLWPGGTGPS
jgi:hypothetical protein